MESESGNIDLEMYKLLFENSSDAIFLTGPDGKIYAANHAAEVMLGMSKEEICSLGRSGIVDTTDPHLNILLEERKEKGKASGELRLIRKDGHKIPVEVSSNIFRLNNNEERTCIIARDNTEKKINQMLFKEASGFNRKIIKSAPIGIGTYNSSGQCIFVNDYFAEIVGATKEQLLKQNFKEIESWRKYGLYLLAKRALNEGLEIHKEINRFAAGAY